PHIGLDRAHAEQALYCRTPFRVRQLAALDAALADHRVRRDRLGAMPTQPRSCYLCDLCIECGRHQNGRSEPSAADTLFRSRGFSAFGSIAAAVLPGPASAASCTGVFASKSIFV